VAPDLATDALTDWQNQAGDAYRARFESAYTYLSGSIRELAAGDTTWSITMHEGRPCLLLAGDTAFALLAVSGSAERVTLKGALHPLDEGIIRVSFSDQLADAEVDLDGITGFKPMTRQWKLDWHGRLQIPIDYWLEHSWPPVPGDSPIRITLQHHERQRAMAHKLASAAGWPMPEGFVSPG
jgi:hypothetical protein